MVDFTLTEDQKMIKTMVREFAEKEVKERAAIIDAEPDPAKAIPWDIIEASNKVGLRNLTLDKKYGGGGADSVTTGICVEELAKCDLGVSVIFAQQWKLVQLMQRLATEEQVSKFLLPLRDDPKGVMAIGIKEPESGSDHIIPCLDPKAGPKMSAVRDGDYVILNGSKQFISNGAIAHLYIIMARTDPKVSHTQGVTMFLVPRDLVGQRNLPGFTLGRIHNKIGERLACNCELFFDNCRVPMANILGSWNRGLMDIGDLLRQSNSYAAASTLGVAWAAFDRALEYTKTRIQGTVPIIQHANVAIKLAEMYGLLCAGELMVQKGCWQSDNLEYFEPALNRSIKPFCSEVSMKVTLESLKLHGGLGIMKEIGAEKAVRDAIVFLHSDGCNDSLNRGIGELLGSIGYAK